MQGEGDFGHSSFYIQKMCFPPDRPFFRLVYEFSGYQAACSREPTYLHPSLSIHKARKLQLLLSEYLLQVPGDHSIPVGHQNVP